MTARYASRTEVPASRTRAEIETLVVERYGAGQFLSGSEATRGLVAFTMRDRQVRFVMPLPDVTDPRFVTYRDRYGYVRERSADAARKEWEQATRSAWRALLLVIRAKLEAVEAGIATFEYEFMANIVMPDGSLIGEHVQPRIADAYASGTMPPLLPDGRGAP